MSDEVKNNEENKFLTFYLSKYLVKKIQGKGNKNYLQLTLNSNENGEYIPKNVKLTVLMPESRLFKKQKEDSDYLKFWIFKDEKFKVQQIIKNPKLNSVSYNIYGVYDSETFIKMTKYLNIKERDKYTNKKDENRDLDNINSIVKKTISKEEKIENMCEEINKINLEKNKKIEEDFVND